MNILIRFSAYCSEYNHNYHNVFTVETGAFDDNDGKCVPIIDGYIFDKPNYVIGHAILHCDRKGVLAECFVHRDILDADFALDGYINRITDEIIKDTRIIKSGCISAICINWDTNEFPESAIVNKNDVKTTIKEED